MALSNFLIANSYSNIQDINYCKQNKRISFALVVYKDNLKIVLVNTLRFFFEGRFTFRTIKAIINIPPESPLEGDTYFVGNNPTGVFADHPNSIAKYTDSVWTFESSSEIFYNEQEDKYYSIENSQITEREDSFDSRYFDTYFSIAAMGGVNKDILAAIYTYLKTRPEFASVTDC